MTLQELLNTYDSLERKGFYGHDITGELRTLPDEEREKEECSYEGIIHSLQFHLEGCHWGTYLGYFISGKNPDGTPAEFPSKEQITSDVVSYSEKRMRQTGNPRMRMWYAAVCWDFMPVLGMQKPSDLYPIYVNSLIETINGDYDTHPTVTAKHIRRAFSLCGNNPAFRENLKSAMRNFTQRHGNNDTSAGIWGVEFDLMTSHKSAFTPEEKAQLLKEHEERLLRLSSKESGIDPFAIQEQATLLADYYKSESTTDNKVRVLKVLEESIRKANQGKSALHRMGMMEIMQKIYNNFSLPNEAKRLLSEIQHIANESVSELQETKIEYTLSQEEMENLQAYIDEFSQGTDDEKMCKYLYHNISKKEQISEQVKLNAQQAPLWAMTSTQMMDEKGRPMSLLRSVEDDLDGHTVYAASQNMLFSANIFHQITQKHINSGYFTIPSLMGEVKKSAVIENTRYEIIEKALTFFFSGDYITFCHLIVPQIEDALRNIVEQNGNPVIKRQRSGFGYQLKTLDEILGDPSIKETLTEDGVFHLRTLLTDQRGLNIRNLLCHGISNPVCFNVVAAERLLHALLLVANIRITSNV